MTGARQFQSLETVWEYILQDSCKTSFRPHIQTLNIGSGKSDTAFQLPRKGRACSQLVSVVTLPDFGLLTWRSNLSVSSVFISWPTATTVSCSWWKKWNSVRLWAAIPHLCQSTTLSTSFGCFHEWVIFKLSPAIGWVWLAILDTHGKLYSVTQLLCSCSSQSSTFGIYNHFPAERHVKVLFCPFANWVADIHNQWFTCLEVYKSLSNLSHPLHLHGLKWI